MSGLQTAYYIVGLVFMGLILLIMVTLLTAVLVIRAKINAIHLRIDQKLDQMAEWAEKSGAVIGAIKKVATKAKH
jgi:hypothetical protein